MPTGAFLALVTLPDMGFAPRSPPFRHSRTSLLPRHVVFGLCMHPHEDRA